MSPIDDELRAALHGRAQVLAPSPDPLAGIEARAKRIQRTRVGGAVAGSVLAVGLVAAVVPVLQSTSAAPDPRIPRVAESQDATTPAPVPATYALDPEAPWTYRGVPQERLGTGSLDTIRREYATKRGAEVTQLTPLFGRGDGAGGRTEVFFLAKVDGTYRWGVAVGSEAGPEFPVDEQLADPTYALAATLPAQDGTPRLLVVAAPDVAAINYRPERGSDVSAMQELARGVSLVAVQAGATTDTYVVVDQQGQALVEAEAPNDGTDPGPAGQPAALDPDQPWEVRGEPSLVTDAQLEALGDDWAQRHGVDAAQVVVRPLYVQSYESSGGVEVVYLVRFKENPWMWGVSALLQGRWSWLAENELSPGTTALAAALPGDEGRERLLVVAAPSAGGAVYAADGVAYEPMTDLEPGVFITSISPGDADDRVQVLDGNGDPDKALFEGPAPDFQNAG
jgi:hypothetical protein